MNAPRRSPAFNALVLGGIVVVFTVVGVILWRWWSVEAASAADPGPPDPTPMWAVVVIGGPVFLLIALIIARMRSGQVARRDDPKTPADDPSRGE